MRYGDEERREGAARRRESPRRRRFDSEAAQSSSGRARRRVARRKMSEETMWCDAVSLGEESNIYRQIRSNRRSDRRAPSDCLFGFNGVDEVAVRERSSTSEKDGGSTDEDFLFGRE